MKQFDNSKASQPIGMFDSGVGGLTVMRKIIERLPKEDILYFGDTERLPYGDKSPETILRYSIENAQFLVEQNVKLLVVACNTATVHALPTLQRMFDIPVIGVIEPAANKVALTTTTGRIAVLATKGTINSGIYEREIKSRLPNATVFSIACPLFVSLVEEQFINHPATQLIIQEYLQPIKDQQVDTVLLACTHYPLLHHLIQHEFGPTVTIVDSACNCAASVEETLSGLNLLNTNGKGEYQYFVSEDPDHFRVKSYAFLGRIVDHVSHAIPAALVF